MFLNTVDINTLYQTRVWIACLINSNGTISFNRGRISATSERLSTGVYKIFRTGSPHPNGRDYIAQYCVLNDWGLIRVGIRTSTSCEIVTANSGFGAAADRQFTFIVL